MLTDSVHAEASQRYLEHFLTNIPWQHDEAIIYGKKITTARKVGWYGDDCYDYTYSGRTRTARLWTPELLAIKEKIEEIGAGQYNSCLLNLYEDGSQGMAWHHDNEKGLGKNSNIASVSFGATRRFDFRHKQTKEKVSLWLPPGSLLIMAGTTQAHWQHQVPNSLLGPPPLRQPPQKNGRATAWVGGSLKTIRRRRMHGAAPTHTRRSNGRAPRQHRTKELQATAGRG